MKKNKAAIGIFKVLLFFYTLLMVNNAFAQGSFPITIPSIPARSLCDNDFPVGAVPTIPAPLLYFSTDQTVATVSLTGIIHIVGIGSTTIQAFQAGNSFTASQVLNITIPSPPKVSIAVDQSTVCLGTPIVFTATVSDLGGSPSYQWTLNGANVGTNSPTYSIVNIAPTDIVQCIVTIGNCHLIGTSNPITGIVANPYLNSSVSISSSIPGVVCSGINVTFTATPVNGSTNPSYQWQVNGVNVGTDAPTFTSSALAGGDKVTCMLTVNGPGCFTPKTTTSNVISISALSGPLAVVGITASANNVVAGTPVTFTATSTLAVAKYQWQVNGVNTGANTATYTNAKLRTGDKVTCIIFTGTSCAVPIVSNQIVMKILPPAHLHITNTFTPNGDGINDLWEIAELSFYPDCLVNIYNRYGKMIYQSRGYTRAWDGSYSGKELPVATYYYVIDLNSADTPKYSGSITIIR